MIKLWELEGESFMKKQDIKMIINKPMYQRVGCSGKKNENIWQLFEHGTEWISLKT